MSQDIFVGHLRSDRLYDPDTDMWVVQEPDGSVTVGTTSFGAWQAGEVIAFTPKPCGADVAAGRGLGTIECAKTVLSIRAPVGLRLTGANTAATKRPALINTDSYGDGWLVRGKPSNWETDRARLVDAAAYRGHCLRCEPDAKVEIR